MRLIKSSLISLLHCMTYSMRSWKNAVRSNPQYMKRFYIYIIVGLFAVSACNNHPAEKTGNKVIRTEADSLLDIVMDAHNVAMPKQGALIRARERVEKLIDSISKLPAKAKEAAAPYKKKLTMALTDLN